MPENDDLSRSGNGNRFNEKKKRKVTEKRCETKKINMQDHDWEGRKIMQYYI